MKKYFLGFVALSMTPCVFAQATAAATAQAGMPMAVCPAISQIKKNPSKGNWTAHTSAGFWKTYHMSFATNLDHFLGAQWVGANVGQVTCIYSSSQQFMMGGQLNIQKTIPELLIYHALAHEPKGGGWKRIGEGAYNCVSQDQATCAFAINTEKKAGNVFEDAESFKAKNADTSSPLNTD